MGLGLGLISRGFVTGCGERVMVVSVGVLLCAEVWALGGYSSGTEGVALFSQWALADMLSVSLICLTVFVIYISLVASDAEFMLDSEYVGFAAMVGAVGVSCVGFFTSVSAFLFFFFFESSLIPTVVLILGWGHQPERLQAGLQMVVYTVCGSLPLLVLLGGLCSEAGSDSMVVLWGLMSSWSGCGWVFWILLMAGMMVKVPLFLVHGWLPKAHVEAPLSGSMVLAGVLLKLGIYGVCRVVWFVGTPLWGVSYAVMAVGLWGGVVCSFLCLCFYDIKSVIAYSSIAHMSLSLGGIMSMSDLGWMGGICMALAHGVCSPCLFSLANYTYMGTGSRSIILCKGILKGLPALSSMWFMFSVVNMGCPPSINFFSECLLFCGILGYSSVLVVPLFLLCFLAAGYSLFLYSSVNHGYQSSGLVSYGGLSLRFLTSMVVSLVGLFMLSLVLDFVFL